MLFHLWKGHKKAATLMVTVFLLFRFILTGKFYSSSLFTKSMEKAGRQMAMYSQASEKGLL